MTLGDIKEIYNISPYQGKYLLWSKTEIGKRFAQKYCGYIYKSENKFHAEGFNPTGSIDELQLQISLFEKSLPYDLEYYYPMFIESVFVHHIIHDYICSLGFKAEYSDSDSYVYEPNNIYGGSSRICLTFYGLSEINKENKVTLHYWTKEYSWIETSCIREVEAIKKMIHGLLKPLFLTDSAANIMMADKMTDEQIDVVLANLTLTSKVFVEKQKMELKAKLQSIIDIL